MSKIQVFYYIQFDNLCLVELIFRLFLFFSFLCDFCTSLSLIAWTEDKGWGVTKETCAGVGGIVGHLMYTHLGN